MTISFVYDIFVIWLALDSPSGSGLGSKQHAKALLERAKSFARIGNSLGEDGRTGLTPYIAEGVIAFRKQRLEGAGDNQWSLIPSSKKKFSDSLTKYIRRGPQILSFILT